MPDRALLKQEAKGILRGARVSPYLFTLVVLVISFVIGRVSDYVQWDTATRAAYEARLGIDLSFLPFCHAPFPGAVTLFVAILCSLLSVILSAGVILYHLGIRRGEVTAIIGNTGSGKSTIAKMLLRFNDVTSGKLLFEGVDVRDVAQAELRSRIAYVPQKAWLFSGTIAENLRHGRADATDEELWHALDVAQASFVRELPGGLNAPVTQGGTNFSGGQRQRLAIARALAKRPEVMVFDDSFSALDYKTDAKLREALATSASDSAVVVVAQRIATIMRATQIIVLDDGRVVGQGTHEELLRSCPTYLEIAQSQLSSAELGLTDEEIAAVMKGGAR